MYLYTYIHTHKERVLHILYCTIIMLKHFNCTAKGEEHFEIHFVWILSFARLFIRSCSFISLIFFRSCIHFRSDFFLLSPFDAILYGSLQWCSVSAFFSFFQLQLNRYHHSLLLLFTIVYVSVRAFFSALINCRRIPLSAKYQSNKKKYSKLSFVHYWPQMCVC